MKQNAARPYLTNPINQNRQHTDEAECKDTKKIVKKPDPGVKKPQPAWTQHGEKNRTLWCIVYSAV